MLCVGGLCFVPSKDKSFLAVEVAFCILIFMSRPPTSFLIDILTNLIDRFMMRN
jgi:hypothetical protein